MLKFLLHIGFLLLLGNGVAQQPLYRHITEDDGLPDNEIYYLYQDKKGVIWISTNSGLCRYNGQSFRHYANPQLKAKSTGCIQEDGFGRIWVNNFSGQLFYVEHDSLVLVQLPGMRYVSSNAPFAIGPGNKLAVSTEKNELFVFEPTHTRATDRPGYRLAYAYKEGAVNPYFDKEKLWACIVHTDNTPGNGNIISLAGNQPEMFSVNFSKQEQQQPTGFLFKQNSHLYFYVRERSSLYRYNGKQFNPEQTYNLPGFKMVLPLQNGNLAFCTNNGLYISTGAPSYTPLNRMFAGQTISAFCEDAEGNLWVGTLAEGIYFIPKKGLSEIVPGKPGISYHNLATICAGPPGLLVLGFLNGELGLLNAEQQYTTLLPGNPLSTKVQSLSYSADLQLLNWQTDKIYQSPFGATIKKWQPAQGVGNAAKDFVYIPKWHAALVATPNDIQLISLDKQNVLERIAPGWAKQYDTFTINNASLPWPQTSLLLGRERGRAVYFNNSNHTIWGADKNGIHLYTENGKKNLLYNNEPIYATGFCDHNGVVWTTTFSQGLLAIQNERVVKQFTVNDGLVSNTGYKILGSGNHLWIVTDKGLQHFNIETETFSVADKTLGLPTYKINNIVLQNGLLYISTPKGLLSVPDSISFTAGKPPQVYLQAVYCNQQPASAQATRFNTRENNFLFRAETPVYSNRALLRYKYRLLGAEKEFNTTMLDNAVFEYKSLNAGAYRFELYLTDVKGNTIGAPVLYSFSIKPPFYQTTWFRLLCILAILLLIYLLFRVRINRIKKREREKLRLAQLETELKQSQLSGIKAQMNPHFMFNALNSIQEFILLNDKKQANLYMGKFADLMRMTLDMTNQDTVLLEDEIRMLERYLELEALRFENSFSWRIVNNLDSETDHLRLPAMLIQPHIENAVKHGLLHKTGERKLDVEFSLPQKHLLQVTITDNGIGRKQSGEINAQRTRKHTSFATGATQKRLDLLNFNRTQTISLRYTDLYDAQGKASGTQVVLSIPV
ncbi:MAG: histidine kinase [Dinghuibacter sp.]|nr:histidine kinase [Dinghuibacter sp.]